MNKEELGKEESLKKDWSFMAQKAIIKGKAEKLWLWRHPFFC